MLDSRDLVDELNELEDKVEDLEYELDELQDALLKEVDPERILLLVSSISEAQAEIEDSTEELNDLKSFIEDIGSEASFGVTLIKANEFKEYCKELVESEYTLDLPWWVEIDWEVTTNNLLVDYSESYYKGNTYYFLSS